MEKNRKTNWLAIAVFSTLALTIYNTSQTLMIKEKIAEITQSNALATKNRLEMDEELQALTGIVVGKDSESGSIMVKARQTAILSNDHDN